MRLFHFLLLFVLISACRQNSAPTVVFEENKSMLSPRERYGDLFVEAQMAGVFPDGKTFVDCRPKYPTDQILSAYSIATEQEDFDIAAFVDEYFELPKAYATNFTSDPNRPVEEHIELLWDVLTRQADEADNGTLIPLPNAYVVPGGRFGEIYYWDSYFTMQGLMVSDRDAMIENMVDNFAYLIDTLGFIPNGNRTYFTTRSQPPFFASMVDLLGKALGNRKETLVEYLPQMEKEYGFWMNGQNRVNLNNPSREHVVMLSPDSVLNRYWDAGDYPREEMYKVDVETWEASGREPEEFYQDIRAACESGWDFSSRWFADGKNLTDIITADIIPVDLNALLFGMELLLAEAYQENGQPQKAADYLQRANRRRALVNKYCWDETLGYYRDYNFVKKEFTSVISLVGAFPLYFNMADSSQADATAKVLQREFLRPGGLVSTPNNTGQQWDAPNGWAPLQFIAIDGLKNYGHQALANEIARRWIDLNIKVYKNTGKLVEKYNVEDMSLESGGGEYPVQDGFGWTNGTLLYLLDQE